MQKQIQKIQKRIQKMQKRIGEMRSKFKFFSTVIFQKCKLTLINHF